VPLTAYTARPTVDTLDNHSSWANGERRRCFASAGSKLPGPREAFALQWDKKAAPRLGSMRYPALYLPSTSARPAASPGAALRGTLAHHLRFEGRSVQLSSLAG